MLTVNFEKEDSSRLFAEFFLGEWLRHEFGMPIGATMPELDVTRQADDSWAWSISLSELPDGCEDDTSYLSLDMAVTWNGTSWSPEGGGPVVHPVTNEDRKAIDDARGLLLGLSHSRWLDGIENSRGSVPTQCGETAEKLRKILAREAGA